MSVDSTPTLPSSLQRKERSCVQVGSCPKAGKPLLAACLDPPSPQGLQAVGNGHEEGLAWGLQAREVTSEQVLGSPHPQSQAESLPRGTLPTSAHSLSPGLPQQGRGDAFPSSGRNWGASGLPSPRCQLALLR